MKFECFVFSSKLLLSVLAALTFFIVSTNASGIDWPEDKATLLDEINHHPTDVISTIENRLKKASLSVHEQAQFHYILSDAYYALFLGDEALAAAKKALLLARKTEDSELVQVCNIKVARAYDTMADPTPGIDYAQQALAWAIENQYPSVQIDALIAIGSINLTTVNLVEALDYFTQAYRLAQQQQESGMDAVAPHIASFIALVYEAQEKSRSAIPYFEESARYYRQTDNQVELSNSLYGLGLAYGKIHQLDKAVDYFNESMAISVEIGDKQGEAYTTQALFDVLLSSNDEHSSEQLAQLMPMLDEAIDTFRQSNNVHLQVGTLLIKAKWLERNALLEQAFEVIEQLETLMAEHDITLQKATILSLKAKLLADSGDYATAYQTLQSARQEEIKRRQETDEERFQQLRAGFELDQKEYENRLLAETNARQTAELAINKRDQTIVALVIAVLVVLFFAIVFMYFSIKRQHQQLEKLAQTDELTGLYNRRQTFLLLEREKKLAVRQNQPLSVAIADLDDFKYINDTYGHQVGDEVLRHVGERIKRDFRNTDIIGRIGGEEFLFVFPAAACEEVAVALRQFMDECKALPATLAAYPDIRVAFSMGLVNAKDQESVTHTLARADNLMYQAKASGKDQVVH